MKLSVAVAAENAPPTAFVVWRGFAESMPKAAEMGYEGVELALKDAEEINPWQLAKLLDRWGLEVSCISTGQVFATQGLYFTNPDETARGKIVAVFTGLIHLAKDFGKLVNIGRVRGSIGRGQDRKEAERLFLDMTRQLCDIAGPLGVTLVLEPVNRYEINFLNNLDEAGALLGKLGRSNIGVMPDLFHMNIEDDRIEASLGRNAALIRYLHLADSNRLAPGWGHLDFDKIFQALHKLSFNGWAAVEILPKPDADIAARQAAEFIIPKMQAYNQILQVEENR
jgi:sugar phosphate isomerase/epimerase